MDGLRRPLEAGEVRLRPRPAVRPPERPRTSCATLAADPAYTSIYRRLDYELTHEIMESLALAMHDRLTAPYSLSQDEAFAREGWSWPFPADASSRNHRRQGLLLERPPVHPHRRPWIIVVHAQLLPVT